MRLARFHPFGSTANDKHRLDGRTTEDAALQDKEH